ncbi:MAG: efflux RND transporter periplasmic adaptor subunit, partial [Verrucomicrobia bacterium]|nr:efflux RND transporter periplasmic adaptor subunit [Verrucomicrobiota bacterium]
MKNKIQKVRAIGGITTALLCALALTACKKEQQQQAAPPPPVVTTVSIQKSPVLLTSELPGRTAAYRIAEIRPQVNGVILKRLFEEGSDVKAGDSLYQIDPAPFQAALNNAKAALTRAEANLPAIQLRVDRYQKALENKAVSQQDYDDAASNLKQAEADIQYYKAMVDTAEINMNYSKVLSPLTGRIGTSSVTDGATVTAYQQIPLATVQQLDPIYVDVPQSTTDLLGLKKRLQNGQLTYDGATVTEVELMLDDNSTYSHKGTLQFRDVTVDPTTSTMTLRMVFPNPDGELLPGMYVRAIVREGINKEALMLPQETVTRDRKGNPYVMVYRDGKTYRQMIEVDRAIGNMWMV